MMLAKCQEFLGSRTVWQAVVLGLVLALAFEAVTCLLRFGFGLRSAQTTGWLATFTFGWRIHHGYVGVLMLLTAPAIRWPCWRNLLIALGLGLFLSDLLHHLCVLWPITGSPEFYVRYPERDA